MLDDWEFDTADQSQASPVLATSQESTVGLEDDGPAQAPIRGKEPIFSAETLERNAARGHGEVTSMAAGNNVLLVGTSKGWLVRHDFSLGDSLEVDLNTPRWGDQSVHRVFLDPSGRHALATVQSSMGGAETFYMHAKWKKARPLSRLKGAVINAVAWHTHQPSDASTRDIVVGTTGGQLFELQVEEREKKEKQMRLLYDLQEQREPFCGVQMEVVTASAGVRYFVIAVTPTKLYAFAGTNSLEATFAAYTNRMPRFTELPGNFPNSEIHFFGKQQRHMERFAWLAGPGIYHAHLKLSGQASGAPGGSEEAFMDHKGLLEYAKLGAEEDETRPLSLAISDFHFLLLYRQRIKVVNRVSHEVVEEHRFAGDRWEVGPAGFLGLCSDSSAGTFYAYGQTSIYEISAHDEGRHMWQVYLDRKEYPAALEHCRDQKQRDRIYAAQAESAFADKDYERAASFFARTASIATFEEVALKFVGVGEQDALRTFLLHKLDHLGKEERSQITMIATWAAELYLDKINRLLLNDDKRGVPPNGSTNGTAAEGGTADSEYTKTVQEFKAFLSDCKDVLDEATTVKLLGSYGREEELVHFAALKERHETVIQHHIRRGDTGKALAVLRKPSVSAELWYKFGPALMLLDPMDTVDSWMAASNRLAPRRLIPALLRYAGSIRPSGEPNQAIRYLEYCIRRLNNEDSALHNLLLSLYAKQDDETALLRFLATPAGGGQPGRPDVLYDPKYALRVCLENHRMRSCVCIYGRMGMHQEAVALALQVDLELAKVEANKVEDDEEFRKKLWLMIARHVIEQERGGRKSGKEGENIRKAIAFLKETDGLLKMEDILPFFPDFTLIDDFKEAICSSLEDYNRQIEDLKMEMNEATQGADNIRRDIAALAQRYAIVDREETCGICGKPLLVVNSTRGGHVVGPSRGVAAQMTPFYVFPCEHSFHADCLTNHVLEHSDSGERERIVELRRRLAKLSEEAQSGARGLREEENGDAQDGGSPLEKVRTQLDDAVAGDCPFCGELMIRAITEPFVRDDEPDLDTWRIGGG